jgi:hypothetical protein
MIELCRRTPIADQNEFFRTKVICHPVIEVNTPLSIFLSQRILFLDAFCGVSNNLSSTLNISSILQFSKWYVDTNSSVPGRKLDVQKDQKMDCDLQVPHHAAVPKPGPSESVLPPPIANVNRKSVQF